MHLLWAFLAGAGSGGVIMAVIQAGRHGRFIDAMELGFQAELRDVRNAHARDREGLGAIINREMAEASRWRDRCLLCESHGPTVGEVDAVFQENVRLKAEVAVLKESREVSGA